MSDLVVCILCFLYVTAEVFAGFLLSRYARWKSEYVRKFIHILTSLIIIPCEYCITDAFWRPALPVLFIFINAFAVLSGMIGPLGIKDPKRNIGLVLYPVSVTAVVLFEVFGLIKPSSAISAVLIMGCGDGAAAVVGTMCGRHSYTVYGRYRKSIEGSAAMAVVAASLVLLFGNAGIWGSLAVGLVMTLVENLSPSSVDNVSVPLVAAFLVEWIKVAGI